MTFLAMLFALTPSLEAMACAAEGCDPACSERLAESDTAMSSSTDQGADNCADANCICVAGHCNHSAVSPAEPAAAFVPVVARAQAPIATERPVSAAPNTLERPPRI